jgi:Ca2+-binding EF-hand superfamily protein
MTNRKALAAATLAALVGATIATALPATARGPEEGMMGGLMGPGGHGPFGEVMFEMLDVNGDGQITVEEMNGARAAMISGSDANQDGKLSVEELAAQDMKMMQRMATARATERVEMLDVDGDEMLSIEELSARPFPARLFARLDADEDGVVTLEEMEAAQERLSERMERGDGPRGRHHRMMQDGEN